MQSGFHYHHYQNWQKFSSGTAANKLHPGFSRKWIRTSILEDADLVIKSLKEGEPFCCRVQKLNQLPQKRREKVIDPDEDDTLGL
jgi:hypothetical protein